MKTDFASWAVSGLQRYVQSYELTDCKGCDMENEFSSLISFWDSCVIEDPDGRHATQEIIDRYHEHCTLENKVPCSKRDILQFIREKTGQKSCSVRATNEQGKSAVLSGYRGFNLLTPVAKEPSKPESQVPTKYSYAVNKTVEQYDPFDFDSEVDDEEDTSFRISDYFDP